MYILLFILHHLCNKSDCKMKYDLLISFMFIFANFKTNTITTRGTCINKTFVCHILTHLYSQSNIISLQEKSFQTLTSVLYTYIMQYNYQAFDFAQAQAKVSGLYHDIIIRSLAKARYL